MTEQELLEREELLEDILDALEDGDIMDVEDLADDAMEQFPKEAFGYFYMGEALFLQTEYDEALEYYEQAVGLAKDNSDYKARVGLSYSKLGREAEAKRAYQDILNNNDAHIDSLLSLAVLEQNAEERETALELLNKALEIDADNIEAYKIRSIVHQNLGDYESAIIDLDNVMLSIQDDTDLWMQKIGILNMLDQVEKAKNTFEDWIALDEQDNTRLDAYGNYLMSKEDYATAEKQYSLSIEREMFGDAAALMAFLNRGWARLRQQKNGLAFGDFRKVTKIESNIAEAYMGMAECKSSEGDLEAAIDFIDLGLDVVIQNRWKLHDKKGEIYIAAQQWDLAKAAFQKNIDSQDSKEQAEGYFGLGKLYRIQGDLDQAFAQWSAASELFHIEADKHIAEHCQAQLQQAALAEESALLEKMEAKFAKNKASKLLSPIFNKIWMTDVKTTKANSDFLGNLPKEIEKRMTGLLNNSCIIFSDRGAYLLDPEGDGLRMYYSIQKEAGSQVDILGIAFRSEMEVPLRIVINDNGIILKGYIGDDDGEDLYLVETPLAKTPAATKKVLKNARKAGHLDYMGADFDAV